MTMNGYVSNTSGSEEPRGVSYDTPSSLFSPKTFYFFNFSHFFLLFFNNFPSNSLQIFKLQLYTLHRTSKQKIKSTKKWVFLEICVNARWEKTFFWILFKIGFCEIIILLSIFFIFWSCDPVFFKFSLSVLMTKIRFARKSSSGTKTNIHLKTREFTAKMGL